MYTLCEHSISGVSTRVRNYRLISFRCQHDYARDQKTLSHSPLNGPAALMTYSASAVTHSFMRVALTLPQEMLSPRPLRSLVTW